MEVRYVNGTSLYVEEEVEDHKYNKNEFNILECENGELFGL